MAAKKSTKNSDGFTMPARGRRKYKVYVISGTHWDREWRLSAEQSKLPLVDMIDKMIDVMEENPDYRHFVLDGGSVVLEDYIGVRPQNRQRLENLIRQGRASITSWYTLPGINLVSGEAIVRNFLYGQRIAREFGGHMRVGYTATGYGQPAQMPQIYQGFGIESTIFYRGTNKHQVPPVCYWQSPDGSKVLLVRGFDKTTRANWTYFAFMPIVLGQNGKPLESVNCSYNPAYLGTHMADGQLYEMPFQQLVGKTNMPRGKKTLLDRYEIFRKECYRYAIGRHIAALNMEDNGVPWPGEPKLIKALNKVLTDTEIVQSSIDECVDAIAEEIKGIDVHVAKGEFRYPAIEYGWNGLYAMAGSARVRLKLMNDEVETGLILVAEPLAALASALGAEYPDINLERAWLMLLKNHAHDSICGASIDEVNDDMAYRFRQVRTVAEEISRRSIENIYKQIDFSHYNPEDQTLTVFNTLPFDRSGVHMFVLDLPTKLFAEPDYHRSPTEFIAPDMFDILDERGKMVDYEIIDVQNITIGYQGSAQGPGASLKAKRHRILIKVDLPSMGYRSFGIRKHPPRYIFDPQPIAERGHIAHPGGIMENKFLRIQINPNGTFNLTDKANKRTFDNLHYFDDRVSGGAWPHLEAFTLVNESVSSLGCNAVITMLESNPMRGKYRIDLKMPVPKEGVGPWYRSEEMVEIPIRTEITLGKDSPRLDIHTKVDNRARDHRLFAMFPTYMKTNEVSAETAFAVTKRSILRKDIGDNSEVDYPYQPMQNFIDVSDRTCGIAIINNGLREYAVWDDPNRTASLTLLRTYRPYINANINMTPEEFDKYPGCYCPGEIEYHYALYPHSGNWQQANVVNQAYDFKTPLRAIQGPAKAGNLPPKQSFFKITPAEEIMMSALYQSDDGMIMRIWNTTSKPLEAKIKTTLSFTGAYKIRMAEDLQGKQLNLRRGLVTVPMRKNEIVTIRFSQE